MISILARNKHTVTVKSKRQAKTLSKQASRFSGLGDSDLEESKVMLSEDASENPSQSDDDRLSDKKADELMYLDEKEGPELEDENSEEEDDGKQSTLIKIDKPRPMTTTVTLTSTKGNILGKRTRTKWERRWFLQPNVLDLN